MSPESEQTSGADATRVTVSYPPDMGDDGRAFLDGDSFRRYLGNAWDELEPGAAFEEMVNLGCCSDAARVTLTVESVEGGTAIGPDTEIEYVAGEEPAGLGCDW